MRNWLSLAARRVLRDMTFGGADWAGGREMAKPMR